MRRPTRRPRRFAAALTSVATLLAGTVATVALAAPARADNVVTPGNFTGFGFDQCVAPTQATMNRWLNHSPFLAAGIYISGESRGCRSQPNLTPSWISTQLRNGWRLLPITLGPQAWCHPSFPRYGNDEDIRREAGADGRYVAARMQGQAEAVDAIGAARRLGIARGSTLWYDLEGFDVTNTSCRESALGFLSGWSWKLKQQGWVSGVYSSASSGIKMLDDARRFRPDAFVLPEYLWIARWDLKANTSTTYISDQGWNPHRRVKQYQGGHNETWGGVTINIDRNWLDVGRGSIAGPERRCGGVQMDFAGYYRLGPGSTRHRQVRALQCLLTEKRLYSGPVDGRWAPATRVAADSFRRQRGLPDVGKRWTTRNWVAILGEGNKRTIKIGSAGREVRRLQRALKAGGHRTGPATGVFGRPEEAAVRSWQRAVGYQRTGVMAWWMWSRLAQGRS